MGARRFVLVVVACAALNVVRAPAPSNAARVKTGDLVVFVADSATSKPLRGVNVTVRAPGWYWSESHQEPEWWAQTDSLGWARLQKIGVGLYEVNLCSESYKIATDAVKIEYGAVDTLMISLVFVPRVAGLRDGCRQCETRFVIDTSLVKEMDRARASERRNKQSPRP